MYRLFALSCLISLVLSVLAVPAGAGQQNPPAAPAEPAPILSAPPGYKYDARGRRDPFVNPVPKPKGDEGPKTPVVRPPGLKGVLVAEATLLGVVTSKEPGMNRAVIQAPGNKTYFASRGDALYDAVVKEIRRDAVVFTVAALPPDKAAGKPASREIVRRVRPLAGENQ